MRVLGYGRVSTDKDEQEASLPNQEQAVRSFCAERTDDGEYGGQHDLVEWYDEQVSGTVPLMDRDTFPKLIDHLNNDETIDGILVKNFKRLGRDVIDQITIKRDLERVHVGREIEVFQLDPWDGQRRSMMDPRTKNLLQADDPRSEMNKALVFIFDGIFASEKSIATSMATSRGMQQKAERDEPIGNLRWGIITDKMYYEDVSEATERLPHPEEFPIAVRALNRLADENYEPDDGLPSGMWSTYNEHMGSPSKTIPRMWKNREHYWEAFRNASQTDYDDLDLTDLELRF